MGVRTFLFLALCLVGALPVALLGVLQVQRWRRAEVEAAERASLASAESLARQLTLLIRGYARAVESLASQVEARGPLKSAGIAALLSTHHKRQPEFFGWYVADQYGISLCNTITDREVTRGLDYSDRDYFQQAKATRTTAVSRVQHGRLSGVPNVQIAAPILGPQGEFRGVAEGSVNLDSLLEHTVRAARALVDGRVVVLDDEDRILADSESPVVSLRAVGDVPVFATGASEAPSSHHAADENGSFMHAAMAPMLDAPVAWRVVAMRSRTSVEQQANVAVRDTVSVVILALLAALFIAAVVSHWLSVPLRALAGWAQVWGGRAPKLPASSFNPREQRGPREFEELAMCVGDMIERIQNQTEHLETEVELRTAELQVLATATQNAGESIEVTDAQMRFVFVNPAFEKLTGYSAAEAIGRTPAALLRSDQHPPEFYAEIAEKALHGVYRGTFTSRRKDGTLFEQEIAVTAVRDTEGCVTQWVAVRRDVSELHRARALLRFNDRMASVGTLAAGIAHEINNPLTYVITNLSVALNRVRQSEVEDALSEALEGACRVRSIVRELRTFSKPDDTPLGPVDVVKVFESALRMVGNELRHRATLERELDEMPPVYGNAAKLGQVFVNGLVNAIQALDEGEAADHIVRVSTTEIGGKVVAEISDTGRGMPPEVLAQAFDPFFTTKAVGHGMGLGLTICHNIIHGMGGTIAMTSTEGRGTTLRVELPVYREDKHGPPACALPRHEAVATSARILIIDDEACVARSLERALGEHHIKVETSGAQGLEAILRGDYQVVLCDLMMPELTGMDIYEAVRVRAPHMLRRMLFMSGGAFTPRARAFVRGENIVLLEKPMSVERLREAVLQVLET